MQDRSGVAPGPDGAARDGRRGDERLLRLPAVQQRVGMSRSAIYRLIAEGAFPKPVRLSPQAVGWVDSEVSAWIADRIDSSRGAR